MSGGYSFSTSEASSLGCERRWFWSYPFGLRPKSDAQTLYRGRIWHSMLETFWTEDDANHLFDTKEARTENTLKTMSAELTRLRRPLERFSPNGGASVRYTIEDVEEMERELRSMLFLLEPSL